MYEFDRNKSEWLRAERGIGFEEIIEAIRAGNIIKETSNSKYPGQVLLHVNIDGYVWLVACVKNSKFLKTAFPSRKATKEYGDKNDN